MPLRAVLPGTIVGVVVLAVFGGIGMFSPTAPKEWDTTQKNVIVASDSTTRYVVLKTDGQKQLHPVLNTASAKLLLKDYTDDVVTVDEKVLDSGKPPHGATLGIPYAPDRLPSSSEAEAAKRWMACERFPSDGGRAIQKAAFCPRREGVGQVGGPEQALRRRADVRDRLRHEEAVRRRRPRHLLRDHRPGPGGSAAPRSTPRAAAPQRVSSEWLRTLHEGTPVSVPTVPGTAGQTANAVTGSGNARYDKVGTVLKSLDGTRMQHYVDAAGQGGPHLRVHLPTPAQQQAVGQRQLDRLRGAGEPGGRRGSAPFEGEGAKWPRGAREDGQQRRQRHQRPQHRLQHAAVGEERHHHPVHVGRHGLPSDLPTGSSSAYVTPGSGQIFRQFQGTETKAGGVFLVTDTGLRYALQSNADSATDDQGIGTTAKQRKAEQQEAEIDAQAPRLRQHGPGPDPVDLGVVPAHRPATLPGRRATAAGLVADRPGTSARDQRGNSGEQGKGPTHGDHQQLDARRPASGRRDRRSRR
ncbi:type VII secretion protein EccB [Streptomyces sp. KL116D]|uniref:type VII secretion protein EccB n=1 Tax=Streptomyces sp. KL116D TaxID=3045152 RepID=UPI003558BECC